MVPSRARRPVTQNHHGTALSSQYLDIQGFSHKHPSDFKQFHEENPTKPMLATECCSCMSQRGVDQDVCPNPKDGGCVNGPAVKPGTFYNNNIGKCTSEQASTRTCQDRAASLACIRSRVLSECSVAALAHPRQQSCSDPFFIFFFLFLLGC